MKTRSALQFVLVIGIVNFFADFTYEGARGIVGPFLGSLGASAAVLGFVRVWANSWLCVALGVRILRGQNSTGIGCSHS